MTTIKIVHKLSEYVNNDIHEIDHLENIGLKVQDSTLEIGEYCQDSKHAYSQSSGLIIVKCKTFSQDTLHFLVIEQQTLTIKSEF
jgi:hypothetical protein